MGNTVLNECLSESYGITIEAVLKENDNLTDYLEVVLKNPLNGNTKVVADSESKIENYTVYYST